MEEKKIVGAVFPYCVNTGRFLLLRRPKDYSFAGCWGFPGGSFDEEDAFPKQTAIREFKEETGYRGFFRISQQPLYLYETNHITIYTYLGLLDDEFVPDLRGEREVGLENDKYIWCTFETIPKKLMPGVEKILKGRKDVISLALKRYGRK